MTNMLLRSETVAKPPHIASYRNTSQEGSGKREEGEEDSSDNVPFLSPVDVGNECHWWDYGQLKLYQKNALLLTKHTEEAASMRHFFNVTSHLISSNLMNTDIDNSSIVSNSNIGENAVRGPNDLYDEEEEEQEVAGSWRGRYSNSRNYNSSFSEDKPYPSPGRPLSRHSSAENRVSTSKGYIRSSVLCNVRCNYIDVEGCVLINVTAKRIIARPGCIIYNVIDDTEEGIDLAAGQVMAGVISSDGSLLRMQSLTTIDGGKAWSDHLAFNPLTFEEVYNMNRNADPLRLEQKKKSEHSKLWKHISDNEVSRQKHEHRIQESYKKGFFHGSLAGIVSSIALFGVFMSLTLFRMLNKKK